MVENHDPLQFFSQIHAQCFGKWKLLCTKWNGYVFNKAMASKGLIM